MRLKAKLMQAGSRAVGLPLMPPGVEARLQVDDAMAVRDIEAGRRVSDETVRRASARFAEQMNMGWERP